MKLEQESRCWHAMPLVSLPGSSIYGVASGDAFFFSTTVEPGMPVVAAWLF